MGWAKVLLGRNTENVLRLIAQGVIKPKYHDPAVLAALKDWQLIQEQEGALSLTEAGKLKVALTRQRLFQRIAGTAREDADALQPAAS